MPDQVREGRLTTRQRYIAEVFISLCILIFAVIAFGRGHPTVRFVSEVIHVQADGRRLRVEGLYRYQNPFPFPVSQGLSCPIPAGEGLGEVEELLVQQVSQDNEPAPLLPVRWIAGAGYFSVVVPADRIVELRVCYTQPYAQGVGRYILTTTKPWKQPLEHGRYELELTGVRLARSNYPVQSLGAGKYTFEKSEFMPDEDWIFETEALGDAL